MDTSNGRTGAPLAILLMALGTPFFFSASTFADEAHPDKPVRADSHAPIGVMAEHMHKTGEWMLSYRYMNMDMAGSKISDERVGPDTIVTTIPNRFFGMPMQPPTLRVVPTDMTMEMHMFGVMYAPTDWVTLMGMVNYTSKEMDHITYMGGMGTTVLGTFTTESDGLGDTSLAGMFRLHDSKTHKVHLNLGITAPTGSVKETDTILTPMGGMPTPRLPYPMQLGSGTWDFRPGVTYNGRSGNFTWGAQYMGTFRLGDNDEDYNLGDVHEYGGWFGFSPRPWVSTSVRVIWQDKDAIEGIDPAIVAPVQTADPNNYGGETLFGYLGVNLAGQKGFIRGHRLALEAGWPLEQKLNGPQLETDFTLTAGWQYAF